MEGLEKSQKDLMKANVSLSLMGLLHFLFGFFASLGYAIALGYWKPFWVASLVAIASTLATLIIGGFLGLLATQLYPSTSLLAIIVFVVSVPFGLIPPLVSFLMFRSRVLALRARVVAD
jgi:uncharacterized membrane protein